MLAWVNITSIVPICSTGTTVYMYIVVPAVISLIKVGTVSECDPVQCQRSQFVETVIARGERHGAWPSGLYRIGHNGQLGPP